MAGLTSIGNRTRLHRDTVHSRDPRWRQAARACSRIAFSAAPRIHACAASERYAGIIGRLAPGLDPAHVEAWMLAKHGDLDEIDAVYFAREVKAAAERARAAGPERSDRLARSFGLTPET